MDELGEMSFGVLYWIVISLAVAIVEDESRVVVDNKSHPNSSRQVMCSGNVGDRQAQMNARMNVL